MKKIQITIDPALAATHGPEIHWVWRLLLTGIGWTWEETPIGAPCDIAYVNEPGQASSARLWIQPNPTAWMQPYACRLQNIGQDNGLTFPIFDHTASSSRPIQTAANQVICQRDLIFDLFWLVTGQEEQFWPKDRHGFHDLTGTALLNKQVLRQALASEMVGWLENTLLKLGCGSPVPRWPNGKRAAAGIGHDVDYPEVIRWLEPLRVVLRQGGRGIGPAWSVLTGQRHHWQIPAWVELEKTLQTRSAFYFVPRQGSFLEYATSTPDTFYDITSPRFRQLFRYLGEEGWEIGMHASYLAYQSQEKFAAEKHKLEEACGQPVVGNRHHYWHLNPANVEETLFIHEQVGFKYDASLIFNRYLGWRRGLSQPFFPFYQAQRRELKTLQIPTAWMDDHLFGQRLDNPGQPDELLQTLADHAAQQQGCLLIDIHDYVFDDTLFPDWMPTFRRLWEYLLNRGDFWFATPAEIAAHWTARYTELVKASHGLDRGRA